jgi:hypothetical protein
MRSSDKVAMGLSDAVSIALIAEIGKKKRYSKNLLSM